MNVFEHLIEVDKVGNLVPRLATSWRWLDDRTVEFKLRQGVTFHNGEIFDAEIVKLNWDENTRVRQPSQPRHVHQLQAGVHAPDHRSSHGPVLLSRARRGGVSQVRHPALRRTGSFYRELGWGEKHW